MRSALSARNSLIVFVISQILSPHVKDDFLFNIYILWY